MKKFKKKLKIERATSFKLEYSDDGETMKSKTFNSYKAMEQFHNRQNGFRYMDYHRYALIDNECLHNQSLLDLAIQHTGSVENAFTIAVANGLSLTDELEAGGESGIPKVQENKDILGYYQAKRLQPATAIQHQEARVEKLEGIDYWAISTDFIIS